MTVKLDKLNRKLGSGWARWLKLVSQPRMLWAKSIQTGGHFRFRGHLVGDQAAGAYHHRPRLV